MRMLIFAKRCAKEILRDPLNLAFGIGFPLVLLFLLSAIQSNVPVPLFEIERLAPGVAVFGLSFITLFTATLVARDRESLLADRLYTTPLSAVDFLLGYMLPIVPIALAQSIVCYLAAMLLGLSLSPGVFLALLSMLPVSLLYIGLGLLFGSLLNVKQVGGVCGALLTNLSAWLSGVWFDVELVGGGFERVAELLPFIHAVRLGRAAIDGTPSDSFSSLYILIGYGVVITAVAIIFFFKQMKKR